MWISHPRSPKEETSSLRLFIGMISRANYTHFQQGFPFVYFSVKLNFSYFFLLFCPHFYRFPLNHTENLPCDIKYTFNKWNKLWERKTSHKKCWIKYLPQWYSSVPGRFTATYPTSIVSYSILFYTCIRR